MARANTTSSAQSTATIGFEAKLWLTADKLRNNMDAAEYKHVVLGLIFLKYISDTFEEHRAGVRMKAEGGMMKAALPIPTSSFSLHTWPDAMVAIERDNPLGSRIAEVRNGSSLFTGDASVRPQLEKLLNEWGDRGKADSEGDEDEEGEADTPKKSLSDKKKKKLLSEAAWKRDAMLLDVAHQLRKALGDDLYEDHNVFLEKAEAALKKLDLKPSASELKLIVNAVSWRVEDAPRVLKKIHKPGKSGSATSIKPDPLRGLFELPSTSGRGAGGEGAPRIVEFEPDSELRDFEQIPFSEAPPSGLPGGLPSEASAKEGIEAFIRREVLPYTPDAWLVEADTKIGYEVSFTRHFYQPPQLRTLAQISADILALEQETEGLLHEITKGVTA